MPAIALPPKPVTTMALLLGTNIATQGYAEGREGRLVFGNCKAVYQAWYNRSEYLSRPSELEDYNLSSVYQSPIIRSVKTTFYDAGQHRPLPFPDLED